MNVLYTTILYSLIGVLLGVVPSTLSAQVTVPTLPTTVPSGDVPETPVTTPPITVPVVPVNPLVDPIAPVVPVATTTLVTAPVTPVASSTPETTPIPVITTPVSTSPTPPAPVFRNEPAPLTATYVAEPDQSVPATSLANPAASSEADTPLAATTTPPTQEATTTATSTIPATIQTSNDFYASSDTRTGNENINKTAAADNAFQALMETFFPNTYYTPTGVLSKSVTFTLLILAVIMGIYGVFLVVKKNNRIAIR